jgi:hypothetical protein
MPYDWDRGYNTDLMRPHNNWQNFFLARTLQRLNQIYLNNPQFTGEDIPFDRPGLSMGESVSGAAYRVRMKLVRWARSARAALNNRARTRRLRVTNILGRGY